MTSDGYITRALSSVKIFGCAHRPRQVGTRLFEKPILACDRESAMAAISGSVGAALPAIVARESSRSAKIVFARQVPLAPPFSISTRAWSGFFLVCVFDSINPPSRLCPSTASYWSTFHKRVPQFPITQFSEFFDCSGVASFFFIRAVKQASAGSARSIAPPISSAGRSPWFSRPSR